MPKKPRNPEDITLQDVVNAPQALGKTFGSVITTGKVPTDPEGKNGFRPELVAAARRLSKPRPRTPGRSTALSRAVTGAGKAVNDFAEGFDKRSTALGEPLRAALRRKRPKQDEAPELRE